LVVGKITETYISDGYLTDGRADPEKINPLVYAPDVRKYQRLGEYVGRAFHIGKEEP
jgi:hypothetical protein